jgi:hypothetical protein
VFLVWHGWWWTAVAFVLLTIAEAGIYHKPNKERSHGSEPLAPASGSARREQ